jgi:hypothetical protein
MIRVEHRAFEGFADDLEDAAERALPEARKVVARGALQIKNDARRRIGRPRHAPAYPASISYDSPVTVGYEVSAKVGPDKSRRQGALGNLLEFGSVNSAPKPHIIPAVYAELPKFERALEDIAERLVGR